MGTQLRETGRNYDSRWWAMIYDQWNETGGRSAQHERELHFCREQLRGTRGAILEAACGTGSIMLPMLSDGLDVSGFDISLPMLDVLRRKAADLGLADIDERISQQDLVDFDYDHPFEAILIPASSIMVLPTQESQIACLRRVYNCLAPGGRLLLNFYIPSYESDLIPYQKTPPVVEDFGEFSHPESDSPIEVWHTRVCDLASQTETWTWFFRHEGETVQVPMRDRWIHKEEFQLLLRLAGFERWEVYGSHECDPFESNGEMADAYWIVSK